MKDSPSFYKSTNMAILDIKRDFNPGVAFKNIFNKLSELIKQVNSNTEAIDALPVQPKVYKALLTQSGTNAPVATVLVNTLGETPVFSYDSTGVYLLTTSGNNFISQKWCAKQGAGNSLSLVSLWIDRVSDNQLYIENYDIGNVGVSQLYDSVVTSKVDGIMTNQLIEIEVYPA